MAGTLDDFERFYAHSWGCSTAPESKQQDYPNTGPTSTPTPTPTTTDSIVSAETLDDSAAARGAEERMTARRRRRRQRRYSQASLSCDLSHLEPRSTHTSVTRTG